MRPTGRLPILLLVFQLGCAGCQEKSPPPAPAAAEPGKPDAPTVRAGAGPDVSKARDAWVVQGDFRLLDGALRTGGGLEDTVPAGERLLVTLHLAGLIPGTDLEAGFEVADGRGTWLPRVTQTLPSAQVRGATGMLQAVLQTGTHWPAGAYTLQVTLTANERKGALFVPFTVLADPPPAGDQPWVSLPERIRAGAPLAVRVVVPWAPGSVGALTVRVDDGPATPVPLSGSNPPGGRHEGVLMMKAPAAPGKHALYFTRQTGDGHATMFGVPFEVLPDAPGPHALRFTTHDGGLRHTWRRRQEGLLLIEDPHWPADAPGTLDVVVMGAGDEVLYLRRLPLPEKPEGAVSLPFSVPEFSPAGRLRFRLRWSSGGRHQELEHGLMVEGADLVQAPHFTISGLELGTHAALVRAGRESMPAGREWHFSFVASGYKTGKKIEQAGVTMVPVPVLGLTCAVSLSTPGGPVVAENRTLVKLDSPMLYVPPRHRVAAAWSVPRLAPGRYLLRLECDDTHSTGSAQLQRPIVIE